MVKKSKNPEKTLLDFFCISQMVAPSPTLGH